MTATLDATFASMTRAAEFAMPFSLFVVCGVYVWLARLMPPESRQRYKFMGGAILYGLLAAGNLLTLFLTGWLGTLCNGLMLAFCLGLLAWSFRGGGPPKPPKKRKPAPAPSQPAPRPMLPAPQPS